mgnify:CR=1 FL=1
MIWTPHATVAVVVEKDGKYLLVEEISHGEAVYNQPAGHVDENESILDAAIRETMEETGWEVKLDAFMGLYTYKAPSNGVTYYRMCFAATAIQKITDKLDTDIISEHWLSYDEVVNLTDQLRSPLVKKCIDDFRDNKRYPLSLIVEP